MNRCVCIYTGERGKTDGNARNKDEVEVGNCKKARTRGAATTKRGIKKCGKQGDARYIVRVCRARE